MRPRAVWVWVTTTPQYTLQINDGTSNLGLVANNAGSVTATGFAGDGSGLTGITVGNNSVTGGMIVDNSVSGADIMDSTITGSDLSGTIKAVQDGAVSVIYTDTTPYASSFTKTLMLSRFDAALSFDAEAYAVDSYTKVMLADAERNTNHTEAESLLNDVFISTSFVNSTKVRMVETGVDTGTFMGSIQVVMSGGTLEFDRIQANEGDTLTIAYIDMINTTGFPKTLKDTAFVVAEVTPTPIVTPSPTPVVTPTPGTCSADFITVSLKRLRLKRAESDNVTVTLTSEGDCPVEGETVKARVTKGKRRITRRQAGLPTVMDKLSLSLRY